MQTLSRHKRPRALRPQTFFGIFTIFTITRPLERSAANMPCYNLAFFYSFSSLQSIPFISFQSIFFLLVHSFWFLLVHSFWFLSVPFSPFLLALLVHSFQFLLFPLVNSFKFLLVPFISFQSLLFPFSPFLLVHSFQSIPFSPVLPGPSLRPNTNGWKGCCSCISCICEQ